MIEAYYEVHGSNKTLGMKHKTTKQRNKNYKQYNL
jgi:hypothetical protein